MSNLLGSCQYNDIGDLVKKLIEVDFNITLNPDKGFDEIKKEFKNEMIEFSGYDEDSEELEDALNDLENAKGPGDLFTLLKDNGWDLWSAAPQIANEYGFEASNYTDDPLFIEVDIEDDDDIETALAIYYMYKKAGWGEIEWVEYCNGFST